jgi:xanthine/CO dehydrogenase XdhC/CoxF family maturation factor
MPVGLKTGGNTAEEIALSIAAEIQSIKYLSL